MRITLNLDDELLAAAMRRARERGSTLTAVVGEALAAFLAPTPGGKKPYRLRGRTHAGPGQPGVEVHDRRSLFDAVDGHG